MLFLANGASVVPVKVGRSNVFVGSSLDGEVVDVGGSNIFLGGPIGDYTGTPGGTVPGPQGPPGPPGADGADGVDGVVGSQIYVTVGAPLVGLGVDGDFAINSSNDDYYSKESGAWILKGQFDPSNIPAGGTTGQVLAKASNADFDSEWVTNDPSSKLDIEASPLFEPDNDGYVQWHRIYGSVKPLQNSPNAGFDLTTRTLDLDPDSSGFAIGTNGDAAYAEKLYIKHFGTSNTGRIGLSQFNFDIGNGTDPITVKGIGYQFGFGQVAAGVTIQDYVQGYGFQPNLNAATVLQGFTTAFYDNATYGCPAPGYISFNASPVIASIPTNQSYTAFNANPYITALTGNAGANGFAIAGTIGTINSGSYNALNVNPTVTLNKGYVSGFNVNLDNVTNYVGVKSSLVVQDITYEFTSFGDNNFYTMEYVDDATAGSESFTVLGNAITCHLESGVSTATQLVAAAALNIGFAGAVTTTITGTPSDPQVTQAATNFAGGEQPGTKECYIKGNLRIDGALSFTGGLSVGALNAFGVLPMVSGTGNPVSIHSLITNPTVAANDTVTLADTLGVNTAMLATIGDNATVTTGFLGMQALGLPAVVTMGAGSTIDLVGGAVFALSLDGAAGGGTIDTLNLCSALAIPNGVTTVNKARAFFYDMPFGDVGTDIWGLYSKPSTAHNWIAGDLVVGPSDLPTNASVGIEINSTTKAMLVSRLTSTEEGALTPLDGMVIYNTTTNKFRGYENGAWVNLV